MLRPELRLGPLLEQPQGLLTPPERQEREQERRSPPERLPGLLVPLQVRLEPLQVWSLCCPRLGHVLPLLCELDLRVNPLEEPSQRVMRRQLPVACVVR